MSEHQRGLYAIADADALRARGLDVVEGARAILAGKPALLQLRAKGVASGDYLHWLRELAPEAKALGVPLVADDRPDLAALAGCDGVHVGQDDLPWRTVRREFPELRVGLSTHDLQQLEAALQGGEQDGQLDYVALGPIFSTSSKRHPEAVVGLEMLGVAAQLAARAGVPLVAIGGIGVSELEPVLSRARYAAMIAELVREIRADGSEAELGQRARPAVYQRLTEQTRLLSAACRSVAGA